MQVVPWWASSRALPVTWAFLALLLSFPSCLYSFYSPPLFSSLSFASCCVMGNCLLYSAKIELSAYSNYWITFYIPSFKIFQYTLLVAQMCPTLCDPRDCSPTGSSVHGTLQARLWEWVAISSSRESSWPRDWTHISCLLHWQADSLTPAPPGEPI